MRFKVSTVTLWVGGQGMVSEKVDAMRASGTPISLLSLFFCLPQQLSTADVWMINHPSEGLEQGTVRKVEKSRWLPYVVYRIVS